MSNLHTIDYTDLNIKLSKFIDDAAKLNKTTDELKKDLEAPYDTSKLFPKIVSPSKYINKKELIIPKDDEVLFFSTLASLKNSHCPFWISVDDVVKFNEFSKDVKILVPFFAKDEQYYNNKDSDSSSNNSLSNDANKYINLKDIMNYNELCKLGILPEPFLDVKNPPKPSWSVDDKLEQVLLNNKIEIRELGACLIPFVTRSEVQTSLVCGSNIIIYSPPSFFYDDRKDFYATIFHEMMHIQLIKDNLLGNDTSDFISDKIKQKNEIAAELGSCVLNSLHDQKGIPKELDDFGKAFLYTNGVAKLTDDERNEIISATHLAIKHIIEAFPEIVNPNYERNSEETSEMLYQEQKQSNDKIKDAYTKQLTLARSVVFDSSSPALKLQIKAELERQAANEHVHLQQTKPAGKELAAAQPERGTKTTAQTPAKTSVSKPQPSKTKEPSKSRDMER